MLGRLIKYEFKSTSRIMIPSIAVWLSIILSIKGTQLLFHNDNEIITAITSVVLFVASLAMGIILTVIIISRFYKTLLGDEGYLTFTLPIKTKTIIFAKYLMAIIWQAIMLILVILCILLLLDKDEWEYLNTYIIPHLTFLNIWTVLALAGFLMLVSAFEIMLIYMAIAIASLFNKHRFILSVVFYIALETVVQIINYILNFFVGFYISVNLSPELPNEIPESDIIDVFNEIICAVISSGIIIVYTVVISAAIVILFFTVSNIFKKHLNLQ